MTSIIKSKFNTNAQLPTILPNEWSEEFASTDNVLFNSLDQFIFTVSKLTQRQDKKCDITYKDALSKLVRRESDFPKREQESIRNLVRSNLLKRGLLTTEVYEDFRYTSDGTQIGVDVSKYVVGEAECVVSPSKQYVDFFYELYVSISYACYVTNDEVRKNVAKLLATIEELERKHIFIKVNVILPIRRAATVDGEYRNFFSIIPVFSHKDFKSVGVMSSVVNERLLRKFYFACLEDLYGSDIDSGYGYPIELSKTMNIGSEFCEIEFFQEVMDNVGVQ